MHNVRVSSSGAGVFLGVWWRAWLLLVSLIHAASVVILLDELLLEDLVDLLRGHADGLVTGLHQALNLGRQGQQLGLVELNAVLALNEGPVDALEHTFLYCLLVALKRSNQKLHVRFHEENLSLLLLAERVEL